MDLGNTFWNVPVPEKLDRQLEDYLKHPKSRYSTKSEFIRDAVRKLLKEELPQSV